MPRTVQKLAGDQTRGISKNCSTAAMKTGQRAAGIQYGHGIMQAAGKEGDSLSGIDGAEDAGIIACSCLTVFGDGNTVSRKDRSAALYGIDHRPLYNGCGAEIST